MSSRYQESERFEQSDPLIAPRVFRNYDELKGGEGKNINFRQQRYQVSKILARVKSLDPRILTKEFEGELVDFSISGVRCSVYGAVPVETGDFLEVGKLVIGDEVFYEGRLRVAHKTFEPANGTAEKTLIGLNLLDAVIDIPRIFRVRSNAEMIADMGNTAVVLSSRDIAPAYRQAVSEFVFLVGSYRNLMARQEQELLDLGLANRQDVQEEVLQTAWENLKGPITELQDRLHGLTQPSYRDREIQELYRRFTMPQVTPLLIEGPFFYRSWAKPLGYPGDYVIMRLLYDRAWEGNGLFSKLIHRYSVEDVMAQAVRSRKRLLRREIEVIVGRTSVRDGEPVRIVSLGSGPACEIIEFAQEYDGVKPVEFVMIDQDNTALGEVAAAMAPIVQKSDGRIRSQFLYVSFADLIGNQDLLRSLDNGHLVYCAGMFDYLSTRKAKAVIVGLFGKVIPGGTLIVGNFGWDPSPAAAWAITYALDWSLRYRSRKEMQAICDVLPGTEKAEVITEETGTHYFIRASKR